MLRRAACAAIIAVALTVAPATVAAQSFDPPTLVVLGLTDAPPEPGLAIYLRPGAFPEVVIAAPPGTSAEQLAAAFRILDRTLKDFKKANKTFEPNSFMRIKVPPSATPKSLSPKGREAYAGYLASFERAPRLDVPGVGAGRAVEVQMPKWPDKSRH